MNTTKMTTHTSVIRIRLPIVLPLMSLSLSASRRTRSTARGPSRPGRHEAHVELSEALRRCLRADRAHAVADAQPHPVADRGCSPCRCIYWRFRSRDLCIHAKHLLSCANPNHISGPLGRRRDAGSEPMSNRARRPLSASSSTISGRTAEKPQPLTTGASWQSGSKLEFGPCRSASRRAEHFLVALLPSNRLFLSTKHLLFEVNRTSDCAKTVGHAHDARTRQAPGGTGGGEAEIVIPSSGASLRLRGIGSPRERAANMAGPRWQRMCPLLCHR